MLEFYRGDSRTFQALIFTDSTKTVAQSLADAAEITFTARLGTPDGVKVFSKTKTAGGVVVMDAAGGVVHVVLVPTDTSLLRPRDQTLAYDIEIRWTGGDVITPDRGTFQVLSDVTYV